MEQEKIERSRRKKNLVIRGVNVEKTNLERRIEKFVKEKLGIGIKVEKAFEIKGRDRKKGIIMTVEDWEKKYNDEEE